MRVPYRPSMGISSLKFKIKLPLKENMKIIINGAVQRKKTKRVFTARRHTL
jgi:hypothetical protein